MAAPGFGIRLPQITACIAVGLIAFAGTATHAQTYGITPPSVQVGTVENGGAQNILELIDCIPSAITGFKNGQPIFAPNYWNGTLSGSGYVSPVSNFNGGGGAFGGNLDTESTYDQLRVLTLQSVQNPSVTWSTSFYTKVAGGFGENLYTTLNSSGVGYSSQVVIAMSSAFYGNGQNAYLALLNPTTGQTYISPKAFFNNNGAGGYSLSISNLPPSTTFELAFSATNTPSNISFSPQVLLRTLDAP